MKEEEVKKVVSEILKGIAPDTDPTALKNNDNIRQVLAIDSFDYLRFIVNLDRKFGTKIPEEDYGKIQTLSDLTNYLTANPVI